MFATADCDPPRPRYRKLVGRMSLPLDATNLAGPLHALSAELSRAVLFEELSFHNVAR